MPQRISSQRRLPLGLLALAMALSAGLTLWWTRGVGFTLDEWGFFVGRRGWSATTLLEPHNGHLIVSSLLPWKLLVEGFGAGTHLPLTLFTVALELAVGGLVYALAALRVGRFGALLPAVLVLFFGAGWEVMMNTAGNSNQLALIGGLGMLLCLQREESRAADLGAALLLALALASHTLGVAFAVGAVVEILGRGGRDGARRLWIVAGPLLVYAVWWLWARKFHQTETGAYAVGSLASGVYDQLAAISSSLAGIFRQPGSPDLGTALAEVRGDRGIPLVLVLIAAVALRARFGPRPSARTWTMVAIVAAYVVLVGFGLRAGRPPDASRYVYTGGVLVLLLIVELCDGLEIGRGWAIAATALTAISLIANVAQMREAGTFFRAETSLNRAELAAIELARPCIPRDYVPETRITTIYPHADMHFTAAEYFEASDELGSPAYSPEQLAASSPGAREAAEIVFEEALGHVVPVGTAVLSSAEVCGTRH